jgi:hypothetical protein
MRNTRARGASGSERVSRQVLCAWDERFPHSCEEREFIVHRLPRSVRVLPCLVGRSSALARFILERWGHMRWWADGAFGNKGRLEGGQYRAGRRAPPLLHRQTERLTDAGGQVCQLWLFRTL